MDSNDKKRARINLSRILLSKLDYEDKDAENVCLLADPGIVTTYSSVRAFSQENENAKRKKEKDKKKDKK